MTGIQLVLTEKQIRENLRTFEGYLTSGNPKDLEWCRERFGRAKSLVVYKINNEIHFTPSCFAGYIGMTREIFDAVSHRQGYTNKPSDLHEKSHRKDGRDTTIAISSILGDNPISGDIQNATQHDFANCYESYFGIKYPGKKSKKFWSKVLEL